MDIAKTTETLEQQLVYLEERLQKVVVDVSQSHSADFEDQAQERENDEVIDVIGEQTEKSIEKVRQALQRIKEGKYGICVQCGNGINPKRLAAIPETITCTQCS